ncbi:hypothetical protein EVAR_51045_1 [Eumeta japonica]|uniref:Uncharacterized protein n=1 Tax=Eumeta variegata TaxID=151549 RepID=A0A4C1Y4D3_EUMVA|nr:hypothetical protein EVAR_51045_1 [Eumeta japonica]
MSNFYRVSHQSYISDHCSPWKPASHQCDSGHLRSDRISNEGGSRMMEAGGSELQLESSAVAVKLEFGFYFFSLRIKLNTSPPNRFAHRGDNERRQRQRDTFYDTPNRGWESAQTLLVRPGPVVRNQTR